MTRPDEIPPRREFKYLVDRDRIPALRAAIAPFCRLDAHAKEGRGYRLRSLYFDAPDLRLFHANEREAVSRFKARVRCYPDAGASSPVFAEIKFRDGDVIRKTRTRLPQDDWARGLRAGGGVPLGPFVARMHQHDLRPVVLVEYHREAWVSEVDEYARVTIDRTIQCQAMSRLSLEAHPGRWRTIDHPLLTWTRESPCVLELKWAECAPLWMVQVVQNLDLLRHSFSKYSNSMLSLAEDHFRDSREAQSAWG
jgi:SPX domain protein involved in polyphosphate accumulation